MLPHGETIDMGLEHGPWEYGEGENYIAEEKTEVFCIFLFLHKCNYIFIFKKGEKFITIPTV